MSYDHKVEFVIDADVLGTTKNLLCNNGTYKWINYVPADTWYLDGQVKFDGWCLDTLLALNQRKIDLAPEQRYADMAETVLAGSIASPPWSMMMPKHHFREHVKKITSRVEESIGGLDENYYRDTWVPATAIFARLQQTRVDDELWRSWMLQDVGNKPIIKTFKPNKMLFAKPVKYNRLGTRTGRLVVSSGPNILNLRRDARKILTSRFEGGSIVQYDFSALEARIVLYEAGMRCDHVDLYDFLSKEIFKGKMPRNAIKQAIISELYGQSKFALGESLSIGNGKVLDNFVKKIKTYFDFEKLMKRVKDGFVKTGYVVNRYKRRIPIEEPLDHILFNSYVQATGVEVSLLGFEELCQNHVPANAVPIFLLHDALLLDVPDVKELDEVVWLKVPGYIQRWPLKLEQVSVSGIKSKNVTA